MTAFLTLASTHRLHVRPSASAVRHFLVPFRCTPPSTYFLHSKSSFQPRHAHAHNHAHRHGQNHPPHRRPTCTHAAAAATSGAHTRLNKKAAHQLDDKSDVNNIPITTSSSSSSSSPKHAPSSPSATKQQHPSVRAHLARGLGVVTLKSNKARLFLTRRATTVYNGAIQAVYGTLHMNTRVVLLDASMRVIGYGLYNPQSLFRVRLLRIVIDDNNVNTEKNVTITEWYPRDDLQRLVQHAVQMRRLFALPRKDTDVYRVVNADGDGIPGLFVDRFANIAVVSSCAAWCEALRDDIETVVAEELKADGVTQIIWRPHVNRLKLDGYTLPDISLSPTEDKQQHAPGDDDDREDNTITESAAEHNMHGDVGSGENEFNSNSVSTDFNTDTDIDAQVRTNPIIGIEQGVRYAVPHWVLNTGQKTGHYADQRDTRAYVADLVKRMQPRYPPQHPTIRLLDLFCYSGGFSLNALLASDDVHATAIDSSKHALAMLRHNAELNGVANRLTTVRGDASKGGGPINDDDDDDGYYDIVIVDPPKLAPNVKALPRALGKYRRINEHALRRVRRGDTGGGVVVSCSCSAAIAQNRAVFVDMVRDAAAAAGRSVALVKTFGAAPDHVVHAGMLETEYLTVCVFSVR